MTRRECAIVQAYTGKPLVTDDAGFAAYIEYVTELLGGKVEPWELRDIEVIEEIREKSAADFYRLGKEATD